VPVGAGVGWPTTGGAPDAAGVSDGVAAGMRGVGDELGAGLGVGVALTPGGVAPPVRVGVGTGVGVLVGPAVDVVGVGTTATGGGEAAERCWSSNPPAPSTIDASTRFTIPRLRMSRARWAEVTRRSGTPLWRGLGLVDGTRGHSDSALGRSP
jgi:hypothetical protein